MDTILVIEDEKEIAELIGVFLEQAGYQVAQAYDGLEGIRLYEKEHPDLVEIYLTGKEFEILELFLSDPHRIMTKDYILEKLWKYEYNCEDGVIYTHIKNIRKKLGVDWIKTLRGVGYKLV